MFLLLKKNLSLTCPNNSMALITCPSCGHQISDKAIRCPKCGYSPSARTNEENSANNPSVNDTAAQNPSVQAEATNNHTSKDMESPVNSSKKNTDKEWQQSESKWFVSARPNRKKSAKASLAQDSHLQSQQKGTRTNKKTATILIIMAAVVAVCAAGAIYGIHRHNIKVLAAQQAELQRQMEEEELARQKAIEDSIARVNFQTPDLKMVGAHGPVKSIVFDNGYDPVLDMEYIAFEEDGIINRMIRSGQEFSKDEAVFRRNSKNLIEEWSYYPEGMSEMERELFGRVRRSFSFNENDFVNKISENGIENSWDETVVWDETGKLSKITIHGCGDGWGNGGFGEGTITYKYNYKEEDKFGNWTKAEVKTTAIYSDYNGTSREDETTHTITRIIEYYE